jgi:glucose-1-phosphate cytidylyltransferase
MKVVLLAGGFGTRLSEETDAIPKPLVEIGGKPILWHIMNIYAAAGLTDFIVCCGYKGHLIKRYFAEYLLYNHDIEVDMRAGKVRTIGEKAADWHITLVDTGLETMTGGRLKRVAKHLGNETFCLTYGDGVADIDIARIIETHRAHGKLATVTAVPSPGRFGILDMADGGSVRRFTEKPQNEMGWINGGFFVLEPGVIDYIEGDASVWERDPLQNLSADSQLIAYRHTGFWQPMDTLRDKRELEKLWATGKAPWKR